MNTRRSRAPGPMRARLAAVVFFGIVVATGCGTDPGRFDDSAAALRSAADSGDRTAALAALDQLAVDTRTARGEGVIDDAELGEISRLIDSSRDLVDELMPPPTTTTTSTTSTTTTVTPPAGEERDEDDEPDEDEKEEKKKKDDEKDDDDDEVEDDEVEDD